MLSHNGLSKSIYFRFGFDGILHDPKLDGLKNVQDNEGKDFSGSLEILSHV